MFRLIGHNSERLDFGRIAGTIKSVVLTMTMILLLILELSIALRSLSFIFNR